MSPGLQNYWTEFMQTEIIKPMKLSSFYVGSYWVSNLGLGVSYIDIYFVNTLPAPSYPKRRVNSSIVQWVALDSRFSHPSVNIGDGHCVMFLVWR